MYRAVDKEGNTVDFMLSEHRDEPEARAFFEKAMGSIGKVTMDKSGANKAGMDTINLRLALLFMMGGVFLQTRHGQVLNCTICLQHTQSDNQTIFEQFYGLSA